MRLPLMISVSVLIAPMGVSSQVPEYARMPRGYNDHPMTVAESLDGCRDGDTNWDLQRRKNRIDPIPKYGWVWVKFDAIRDLRWPRAADRVDRFSWNAILTRAQRDSIRAYEGTPVAVDGFLKLERSRPAPIVVRSRSAPIVTRSRQAPGVAARDTRKASSCDLTSEDLELRLWLTGERDDPRATGMVVSVTQLMRQPGWDLSKLREIERRGLMVRVWGWLLYDQEHPEELGARGSRKIRDTLWEVHPVVEIEVFQDKETLVPLREWDYFTESIWEGWLRRR